MTLNRLKVKQGKYCKTQIRCEHLNAVISYIQCKFTIDFVLLYCIISNYATTYFTHQIKTNQKMQCKVESVPPRYTYFQIKAIIFHASDKLIVMHLEGFALFT